MKKKEISFWFHTQRKPERERERESKIKWRGRRSFVAKWCVTEAKRKLCLWHTKPTSGLKDKSEERWVDGHTLCLKLSGSRDDRCYIN